jgi:polyhydroxyalkanoate synthesis regulator phasin
LDRTFEFAQKVVDALVKQCSDSTELNKQLANQVVDVTKSAQKDQADWIKELAARVNTVLS